MSTILIESSTVSLKINLSLCIYHLKTIVICLAYLAVLLPGSSHLSEQYPNCARALCAVTPVKDIGLLMTYVREYTPSNH